MKGIRTQINQLWILYLGLIRSYLGIFLVSIWLTRSIELFLRHADRDRDVIIGLIGLIALGVGILLVLFSVFNWPRQEA
jgi:ABC-type Mn2+/Zn2+ transport system permease subunit